MKTMNKNSGSFDLRGKSIILLNRYLVETMDLHSSALRSGAGFGQITPSAGRQLVDEVAGGLEHVIKEIVVGVIRLGGTLVDALGSRGAGKPVIDGPFRLEGRSGYGEILADLLSTLSASLVTVIQAASEAADHEGLVVFAHIFQAVEKCLRAAEQFLFEGKPAERVDWPLAAVACSKLTHQLPCTRSCPSTTARMFARGRTPRPHRPVHRPEGARGGTIFGLTMN